MAPMRTEGTAMTRQPKAARNERTWAYVAEEADRTLWKYTCQGIPPSICSTEGEKIHSIEATTWSCSF